MSDDYPKWTRELEAFYQAERRRLGPNVTMQPWEIRFLKWSLMGMDMGEFESVATEVLKQHERLSPLHLRYITGRLVRAFEGVVLPPPVFRLVLLALEANPHGLTSGNLDKAIKYLTTHPDASLRQLARAAGVSPTTIKRWREDGDL